MRILAICLLLGWCCSLAGAAELRDPLRPSGYSAAAASAKKDHPAELQPVWQLTAVLVSDARLVAVINDQTVQVGDLLDGYRVQSISRDQVVLKNKKRRIVVKRSGTGLKKPVAINDRNGKKGSAQ